MHPRATERFRSTLANYSLLALLAAYVGVLAVLALGMGLLTMAPAAARLGFTDAADAWLRAFGFLVGLGPAPEPGGVLWSALRLILHTVLLGGVVFKLLLANRVFVFRPTLCVHHDPDARSGAGGWVISLRLYNGTNQEVRNVSFSAYMRVPFLRDGERLIRNPNLVIAKPMAPWRFSLPMVPFTCRIELDDGDVEATREGLALRRIQGRDIRPENFDADGESFLVLCVTADMPRLGPTLHESAWFTLSGEHEQAQLRWGRPCAVQVRPGRMPRRPGAGPRRWPGWDDFERERRAELQGFVLGYGSLIHPQEHSRLRGEFDLLHIEPRWTRVEGFALAWSVAMDNSIVIPGYKRYFDPVGETAPEVFVTFINVERQAGAELEGLAIPVDERLRRQLDRRERNYEAVRCGSIEHEGRNWPLWVYVGLDEAKARYRRGVDEGRAVISQDYFDRVLAGYRSWKPELAEAVAALRDSRVPLRMLQRQKT